MYTANSFFSSMKIPIILKIWEKLNSSFLIQAEIHWKDRLHLIYD